MEEANSTQETKEKISKENAQSSQFKKWLEVLQQESWQLELLISGFCIVLLFQLLGGLADLPKEMTAKAENPLVIFAPMILLGALWMVTFSLIMHLLFRGLWVGAIGLRYVSNEIEYDQLKFTPRFLNHLRKKVGSYDDFIAKVEKICSVLFAFAFLIFFSILGLILYMVFLGLMFWLVSAIDIGWIAITLMGLSLLCGVIYMIDFILLGAIKKIDGFDRFYLPVYRLFSIITFSWLYRPLYYNFIDDKFSRRFVWLIIPYILGAMIISNTSYEGHPYFPIGQMDGIYNTSGIYNVPACFYDDERDAGDCAHIMFYSVPSKVIRSNYLEVFLSYNPGDNKALKILFPEIKEYKSTGWAPLGGMVEGFKGGMSLFKSEDQSQMDEYKGVLDSIGSIFTVYLDDSLLTDLSQAFYTHPNAREKGILTLIDIIDIERGPHKLTIGKKVLTPMRKSIMEKKLSIPIWFDQPRQ